MSQSACGYDGDDDDDDDDEDNDEDDDDDEDDILNGKMCADTIGHFQWKPVCG